MGAVIGRIGPKLALIDRSKQERSRIWWGGSRDPDFSSVGLFNAIESSRSCSPSQISRPGFRNPARALTATYGKLDQSSAVEQRERLRREVSISDYNFRAASVDTVHYAPTSRQNERSLRSLMGHAL